MFHSLLPEVRTTTHYNPNSTPIFSALLGGLCPHSQLLCISFRCTPMYTGSCGTERLKLLPVGWLWRRHQPSQLRPFFLLNRDLHKPLLFDSPRTVRTRPVCEAAVFSLFSLCVFKFSWFRLLLSCQISIALMASLN